ncbi:ABC transporter substrate-binding protein [Parafrankia colletiae]|uniref:ABC transporter substrate-binding protein n=1 Tax=Parafrankia colletiae TaxID=573497 RepID=A0A1S1QE35_9ACTN|nr:ABC transporter substrate-binding protein [Parafrankia colletiae]MCK9902891.1 ABC transporter substrate-binding protein [Frankia sp. Cpl3]OHV33063.1 ABC transporter substrate-binding protein [Parafrankia colletiae]
MNLKEHAVFRRRSARGTAAACAAALALTLGLAACGSDDGDGDQTSTTTANVVPELGPDQLVSIVFESYNLAQAGPWTDTFKSLIADFQKSHPNITVTAQKPQSSTLKGYGSAATASIQAQLATGNAPDVAQLTFGDLDYTVDALGAKPLDDVVGHDAVQANFAGTHPFAPAARTLGDADGKTYGVPFVFSTPVLYYNADLFRQAGLDPEKPPTTWAEFKTAALAIKEKTGKEGSYIDCLTKVSGDWCYQALVASNGGSVISEDRSKLTFADAPAVAAVSMAQDLVTSGASPKLSQDQAYPAFARGEIGMIVESSSAQQIFLKGAAGAKPPWTLRATVMPSFGTKPVVPTNSGAALFMFGKDPAKQRAAWELIEYLTSDAAYTQITSKIGYLPLRTGLLDDPNGLKTWAAENPLVKPNLDQLARLKPWVSFPGKDYVQIRTTMLGAVENVVYNGADPQKTLTEAQEQAAKLLPRS